MLLGFLPGLLKGEGPRLSMGSVAWPGRGRKPPSAAAPRGPEAAVGALRRPQGRSTRAAGASPRPRSAPRVMSSTEAKLIYQKYDEMMELLRKYREKIFQDWVSGVDQDCHFNLGQPLIQRDHATNLIRVNFSKAVGVPGRRPEQRPRALGAAAVGVDQ